MTVLRQLGVLILLLVATLGLSTLPSAAQTADAELSALVDALAPGSFKERGVAVEALAATGDQRVADLLNLLSEGELYVVGATGRVGTAVASTAGFTLTDPVTGASIGEFAKADVDKVKVNNGLRRVIRTAVGQLTLLSPDRNIRMSAAQRVLSDADPANLELLESAIAAETDASIKTVMEAARAVIVLNSAEASIEDRRAAIPIIAKTAGNQALSFLTTALNTAPEELKADLSASIASLEGDRAVWDIAQNVWFGVSLGSVLLLAAIGLAITFGVMGVINMAHGEMVMIGAYTTFVVQEVIRQNFPGLFDWSLAIALPLAFLVAGLIGIAIERSVIRWLYGRPLETLLATWGISLLIQQAIRTIFSANIREVGNPSWMSGSFELGGLFITWNRFYIVLFALCVFAALLIVLNRTPLGLQMRAVTQNRRMASSMGIRTPFVDAMTFGLGSGIAGLAGVALSQIGNVSPDLGQGYIIDSFMVVVFGGVGNLWGTLVGALTIGIGTKFLEASNRFIEAMFGSDVALALAPYTSGPVLAKILILVLIILFIQRRPRGLFALKGRAVDQ